MNKILVTGGCGFLGSNIAEYFLTLGWEIIVIDLLLREGGSENKRWLENIAEKKQMKFYKIDLANQSEVEKVFMRHTHFDYICHLGGQVAMTTSLSNPRRDYETNVLGTFNVLESARKYSPEALIAFSSTNKVYGDLRWVPFEEQEKRYTPIHYENGFDESLPLDFSSPYGCSKGSADQYVREWYRSFGLRTVVLRHSSIYGGRQFSTFDQGWVGWFCKQAIEQKICLENERPVKQFTISGSGKQVRDVLHAQDLVNLYYLVYKNIEDVKGEVYNIGGGKKNALSLLELFSFLESEMNFKLKYNKISRRQSDQDYFVADLSKIHNDTGWSPSVDYKKGMKLMLEWIEENV